jgi:hypothetical protein
VIAAEPEYVTRGAGLIATRAAFTPPTANGDDLGRLQGLGGVGPCGFTLT